MVKPEKMPKSVKDSLMEYCKHNNIQPEEQDQFFAMVKFDSLMGCYFFIRNEMFHGVEMDGYIHT